MTELRGIGDNHPPPEVTVHMSPDDGYGERLARAVDRWIDTNADAAAKPVISRLFRMARNLTANAGYAPEETKNILSAMRREIWLRLDIDGVILTLLEERERSRERKRRRQTTARYRGMKRRRENSPRYKAMRRLRRAAQSRRRIRKAA
jgi:hypothetical protein